MLKTPQEWADVDARLDLGLARSFVDEVQQWRHSDDPESVLRATRVLRHLGDDRSSDALSLRAGRRWPQHAGLQVALLRAVLGNRGPYAYWAASRRYPLDPAASESARAERLSLQGFWLAYLRDAPRALANQREALRLQSSDAWLWVEHSYALSLLDQPQQAMEAIEQGLQSQPRHRAALQQRAQLWWQQGRRDDARASLESAWLDCGHSGLALQLLSMAEEESRHADALLWLDELERAVPLADKNWRQLLAARRADAMLHVGRLAEAREQALKVPGTGFYSSLAERLAAPDAAAHRVLLPLEQVTQHWNTCAPATLTALVRYWGRTVDHLELAQEICYDGTPYVAQRRWAQREGFVVREFKPDWDTTCALIDAGLPFALGTQSVGAGHLQAVVGYDRLRRTLLVRDPNLWRHSEYLADPLFDEQWAISDRGLLMLPPEAAARLDGITLPQVADWDIGYEFDLALDQHDRARAVRALVALTQASPQGLRLLRARRALAIYDGDEAQISAATEALLARFPQDVNLRMSRVSSLFALQGAQAGDAELRELVEARYPDPTVLARWAGRLALDARRLPEALFHVRRALRRNGTSGVAWGELGDRCWQGSEASAALEPLRWASTLQPTSEWPARNYARACRVAGQAEQGLAWLRERVVQWGERSSAPALSLADELDLLQRQPEAEAVLRDALQRRPADAELLLELAQRRLRQQRVDEAGELLQRCPNTHEANLLRVRALWREARGEWEAAQADVRLALQLAPLDLGLHRLLWRQLRRQLGVREALQQWRPLADAQPAHVGLQRLLYDLLPDDADSINAQLDRMNQLHPNDDWLQRERAVQAGRQGRLDEAVSLAEAALQMAPNSVLSHNVLAYCHWRRDGYAAAATHWRAAISRDADFEPAVGHLLSATQPEALQAAAEHLVTELQRQVLMGDGLLHLQAFATRAWPDAQVLEQLQALAARWPGLWQSGVAMARQLLRMGRPQEALERLQAAAAKFPELPRVHLELSIAQKVQGSLDEAIASGARALALSPAWNEAVRHQVNLLAEVGARWVEAQAVLETALQDRNGFDDADLIGLRAWVWERQGDDAAAWSEARRSLMLDPPQEWVWAIGRRIAERAQDLTRFDALIDEVVRSRPGDASAWLVQAIQWRDDAQALDAAERAIALEPRLQRAWQERFSRLCKLGRDDELLRLLEGLKWPGGVPLSLRAWRPRLRWRRGERPAALSEMLSLCEAAPNEWDLWVECADWADELQDNPAYLRAAERMLACEPQQARSHAYLGHAQLRNGHVAAIASLQRACALNPSYTFAVYTLVDAAITHEQPRAALDALNALWLSAQQQPDAGAATRGLQLARRAGDEALAFEWLERLFTTSGYHLEACKAALDGLRAAGWSQALEARLAARLQAGAGPVGVALYWLQWREEASFTKARREALAWLEVTPHLHLLKAMIRWLAGRDSPQWLLEVTTRFEAALRSDEEAWGEVGWAFLEKDGYANARLWMADWATRRQPPVWALTNLCAAHAMLNDWPGVAAVIDAWLGREPYEPTLRFWQLGVLAWRRDLDGLRQAWALRHEWQAEAWMKPALEALQAYLDEAASGFTDRAAARRLRGNREPARKAGYSVAVQSLLEGLSLEQDPRLPGWLKRVARWWIKE